MSVPLNPLSNFQSYSYYHVLAICDSTETANALITSNLQDIWLPATNTSVPAHLWAKFGKRSPRTIKLNDRSINGQYSIFIDGSRDGDFSIEAASWTTVTTASVTASDNNTSIAINGSMTIIEPKGILLADTLVNLCVEMGIDSAQAVYVLKTFFIGHSATNDTPQTITNVKPLMLLITNLSGKFTEAGGTYLVDFTAMQHGVTRLPQYSQVAESININSGSTLTTAIAKLNDSIQRQYDRTFTCIYKTFESNLSDEEFDNIKNRLAPVKYTIELDPMFRDSSFVVSDQLAPTKDTPDCNAAVQLSFPAGTSIEEAIRKVMASCRKVTDLQNGYVDGYGGKRIGYKIYSRLNSIIVENQNNLPQTEYIVTYGIKPFLEPRSINFAEMLTSGDSAEVEKLRKNIIEFDYLFTGRNIDIIDFDITLNTGIAYLQTASMANSSLKTIGTPTADKQIVVSGHSMQQVNRMGDGTRVPIFFSTPINSDLYKNSPNLTAAGQAVYNLNNHASFEVQNAALHIIGNPKLLDSTNAASYEVTSDNNISDTLNNFGEYPAFAKVNIKMPRDNNDISLYAGMLDDSSAVGDFTTNFWFQGYYYITEIEHIFDKGVFTQQLSMIGLPEQTSIDASIQDRTNSSADFSTRIGECCGDKNSREVERHPSAIAFPAIPRPDITKPDGYTQEEIDRITRKLEKVEPTPIEVQAATFATNLTLANVKMYPSQPDSIKTAISNASKLGVSEVSLAQFAYIESKFDPNAANKGSSARGLYQFMPKTWTSLATQGKIPGLDKNITGSELLDLRFNPTLAANATASLMRDHQKALIAKNLEVSTTSLYLAHYLGIGRTITIMSARKEGKGNSDLLNVLTADAVNQIKTQNPEMRSANTPNDIWNITAAKISNSLTNVVNVAKPTEELRNVAQVTTTQAVSDLGTNSLAMELAKPGPTAMDKLVKAMNRKTKQSSNVAKIDCSTR